jgi:lysine 2,3-aminomutase
MDLVGNSTPTVSKAKLTLHPADRYDRMLDYLRATPTVRDVVVSGGDVANVPWPRLESFVLQLLEIDTIRDIRLATKALAALPQHWLQAKVVEGVNRVAQVAAARGVNLALHTHINHVQSVTPLVAEAARALLDAGLRDVRNQGVLMRGVNAAADDLLDLCFALQGEANILPYYFYMCDMIPNAEHWRTPLWQAQQLQLSIMGYLPGFATPRIVCDVPYVGKRWVHQVVRYDRNLGISYWSKNYRTGLDGSDADALNRVYPFYDPIDSLPASGQAWWRENCDLPCDTALSVGYESVTLASDGGTVPQQCGAAAGSDGGEDPASTPREPLVILPSNGTAAPSGSFRNGHGHTETCISGEQFAVHAEPVSHRPSCRCHGQHVVRDDAGR